MPSGERLSLMVLPSDPVTDRAGFELLGNQLQMAIESGYESCDRDMIDAVWKANLPERRNYWTNLAMMHVFLGQEVMLQREEIVQRDRVGGVQRGWQPEDITFVMRRAIKRVNPEASETTPLMRHLDDTQKETRAFFLTKEGESRFPDLITTEMARAVALVVAPNHDLLKFLSHPSGQAMRDHEQVAAWLLRQHFGGISELRGMVDKAGAVVVNHENMMRPDWHRQASVHAPTEVGRARGVFFVMDVMTGVFQLDEYGYVTIDEEKLQSRFGDLYFRHIDRSGMYSNAFSPEWGLETIKVAIDMFGHMEEWGWLRMQEGWQDMLWKSGHGVVERVMERHYARVPGARLTDAQYERVISAREWFEWALAPEPEMVVL